MPRYRSCTISASPEYNVDCGLCIASHVYAFGHLGPTEHSSSPWKEEILRTHFLGISAPFSIDKPVSKMSAAQHTVDRTGFLLTSSYSEYSFGTGSRQTPITRWASSGDRYEIRSLSFLVKRRPSKGIPVPSGKPFELSFGPIALYFWEAFNPDGCHWN